MPKAGYAALKAPLAVLLAERAVNDREAMLHTCHFGGATDKSSADNSRAMRDKVLHGTQDVSARLKLSWAKKMAAPGRYGAGKNVRQHNAQSVPCL